MDEERRMREILAEVTLRKKRMRQGMLAGAEMFHSSTVIDIMTELEKFINARLSDA